MKCKTPDACLALFLLLFSSEMDSKHISFGVLLELSCCSYSLFSFLQRWVSHHPIVPNLLVSMWICVGRLCVNSGLIERSARL